MERNSEMRERFLAHGIPYDDIDEEMRELVDVFNFKVNMKTEFCCYGHKPGEDFSVIFDESVTDDDVMQAIKSFIYTPARLGCFYKWVRISGSGTEVLSNWIFKSGITWENEDDKKWFIAKVVNALSNINGGNHGA